MGVGVEARAGGADAATGLGACTGVRVAAGLSLTEGLGAGVDLGVLLGKMVVSLRISVPRMGVTSDGTCW